MPKRIFLADNKQIAVPHLASHLIDWCEAHPRQGLGGATGRSPVEMWSTVWEQLAGPRAASKQAVVGQDVVFLDEYFGAYPAYYHWAYRNLRIDQGGFESERCWTPRGAFFEDGRLVNSSRLDEILADWPEEWKPLSAPGEDGNPPEIRISPDSTHPVLSKIREAMADYDQLVRELPNRLQLLGVGVGGAIERDPLAGGHIGFVEYGAAAGNSQTMLVRLAPSTSEANASDFALSNQDGDVALEPAGYAITQGVATILSAGELLLMAWGAPKSKAIERMLFGRPSPQNPAAWIQNHNNVTLFLDRPAFGQLDLEGLAVRGWELHPLQPAVVR